MNKNLKKQISWFSLFSIFLPVYTYAQESIYSNVRCGYIGPDGVALPECGFNEFILLIQNLISFSITYIIMPLVVLVILYYGSRLVISSNKPGEIAKAKAAITKVVIGLFFMLGAWLIMNLFIKTFRVNVNRDATQGPIQLLDK